MGKSSIIALEAALLHDKFGNENGYKDNILISIFIAIFTTIYNKYRYKVV